MPWATPPSRRGCTFGQRWARLGGGCGACSASRCLFRGLFTVPVMVVFVPGALFTQAYALVRTAVASTAGELYKDPVWGMVNVLCDAAPVLPWSPSWGLSRLAQALHEDHSAHLLVAMTTAPGGTAPSVASARAFVLAYTGLDRVGGGGDVSSRQLLLRAAVMLVNRTPDAATFGGFVEVRAATRKLVELWAQRAA